MLEEEDGLCGGCGQPRDESMAPGSEDAYRTRLIGCFACAEMEKARLDLRESPADAGMHVVIERVT